MFALTAMAGGLVIALVVAELVLRLAGYSSPEFYMTDESRGYTLIPGMRGQYRKEGASFVEINADGFRDAEHALQKDPATLRIAVLGDSYVEALQVEHDQGFWRSMTETVQDCGAFGGRRVEVLKFGVSGYSTAQELLMVREEVWKYSPDIVMLVMTTNNDITDNTRFFKKTAIPYFVYHEGGRLTLDDSFRNEKTFLVRNSGLSRLGISLKNNLRFVQAIGEIQVALKYRYRAWKERPTGSPAGETPAEAAPAADVGIDNEVYRPPGDQNWENAWRVTEGLIEMMNKDVTDKGARFVVVTASNGVQVLPNPEQRTSFAKRLGTPDLLYPDRRIAEFCRARAIPVITLAPALADHAARENVYLHGFEGNLGYGHWNQAGHTVAGREIAKHLCESLLP